MIDAAQISVNVDIPRAHLDDTTAHAILCIIRELVANAIHHGDAYHVCIHGECRNHSISFSVSDDGHGFDTEKVAGAAEGHFGLEGIRERIKRLNGTFAISSTPGDGCKAEATIPTE